MDTLHLEHVEDLINGRGRVDFIRSLQPKDQRGNQRESQPEDAAHVVKPVYLQGGGLFFPFTEQWVFLFHGRAGGPDPRANRD